MTVQSLCQQVLMVTGTCKVGEQSGCEAGCDESAVDLQVVEV